MDVPPEATPRGDGTPLPTPSAPVPGTRLTDLDDARSATRDAPDGARLARLRDAVPALAAAIAASGQPTGVTTGDLTLRPHPTGRALGRAARSPAPSVWLTHRLLVVQWHDGTCTRTLLWCPTDHERPGASATGGTGPQRFPVGLRSRALGTVLGHLRALGIDPSHVDLLAFPDLQGQDVRRWLGTTRPAPDLGADEAPVVSLLPRATLLVRRTEWETLGDLHPLQRPGYHPDAFRDLPADRIAAVDGDVLLGPGIAVIGAAGRTPGTASLVLQTERGRWVVSANGVAAECWAPRASRLPGLRRYAVDHGQEVIPHRTGADAATAHHDAMVVERLLADPCDDAPFPRCFPTSELTAHRLAPGLTPTHVHGRIAHGLVRGDRLAGSATDVA